MKMFRERDSLPLGALTIVWLLAVVLLVLNINSVVGAFGRHYSVVLPEAAGLKQGDPVRVSGLKVGRVGTVKLGGKGVVVDFTVTNEDITLGDDTRAAVQVATVLGDKALVLTSEGSGSLAQGAQIPIEHTSAPYDVSEALSDLTTETGQIDIDHVAQALDSVSTTLDGATPQLRSALRGVGRLSQSIGSRDQTLRSLLSHAEGFSKVLADRGQDMKVLVRDGNLLLAELIRRRDDVATLLTNVSAMSRQLSALVDENATTIGPALRQLNRSLDILRANKSNLEKSIKGLSVYVTGLGEVVGSGPFFTAYLQNLVPGNFFPPSLGADR